MKKFQIITEMHNKGMMFNTASTSEEVDQFVDEFNNDMDLRSIKVYRYNLKASCYQVVYEDSHNTDHRMIGFGRW